MKEHEKLLLEALKAVRDRPKYRISRVGICGNVDNYLFDDGRSYSDGLVDEVDDLRKSLLTKWPEGTGGRLFVVCTDKVLSAGRQYDIAADAQSMWDETTEYGQARWRLLHWLIAELERAHCGPHTAAKES